MRRLAWLLFACAAVLAPVGIALAIAGARTDLRLPAGRGSELLVEVVAAVAALLFAFVGLLIARRERANPIGWIFLGSAVMLGVVGVAYGYADLALYGGRGWSRGTWAAWVASWLFIVPVFVAPCCIAQLFPDGRPMAGRWRLGLQLSVGLALYLALAPALGPGPLGLYPTVENPAALPESIGRVLVDATWGVAVLVLFVLSLSSIVKRFRRARGVERQQLRWLAFAGVVVIAGWLASFALGEPLGGAWETIFGAVGFAGFLLMPVAVAIAILRYRLYEIDRIISRTLVYATLTGLLGGMYVGLVLGAQAVFSSFAGGSNLAIAVSTLVVAALFLPVRSRVQGLVDRRFYRRRYDAQRTLAAFGARLREQVELETLSSDLRGVVGETMQPAHVSVWLREGAAE